MSVWCDVVSVCACCAVSVCACCAVRSCCVVCSVLCTNCVVCAVTYSLYHTVGALIFTKVIHAISLPYKLTLKLFGGSNRYVYEENLSRLSNVPNLKVVVYVEDRKEKR